MAKIYGNRWLVKKSLNEGGQSVVLAIMHYLTTLSPRGGIRLWQSLR